MSGYVPTLLEVRASVDGTLTYFDLINGGNGLFLDEWEPSVVQEKGGGVFSDSPISDGKSLVFERWDNAIENIKVKAKAQTGNAISLDLQDLFHLFQMAKSYSKTTWQTNPVYLAMQPAGQTNEQYAPIIIGRVPNLSNPVRQPWYKAFVRGGAAIDNLPIIIERGHWLENVPGTGTPIEALARETYNGRVFGNVDDSEADDPTTEDIVFVANKRNVANLTHVFVDDGGAFPGGNSIDDGILFGGLNYLPAVPAVNDAVYFGIQTSLTDSGPFSNLVVDLDTAGSGYTATWEYWNGATWAALQPYDPSSSLTDGTGVYAVAWNVPSDWATTAVNAVTGYWVRMRVTGITTPSPPQQVSGRPYSVVWPYAEVRSDQVAGDIPALGKLLAQLRSNERLSLLSSRPTASGVLVGLRRTSRGEDFTAYINFADEQNPSGITVSSGAFSSFANDVQTPSGRCLSWSYTGIGASDEPQITLSKTMLANYGGRFRMMVRVKQVGGTIGDISVAVKLLWNVGLSTVWETDSVTLTTKDEIETLDFGEIEIDEPAGKSRGAAKFYVNATDLSSGSGTFKFIDFILLPVDEISIESYDAERNIAQWGGEDGRLLIDGVSVYGKTISYIYDSVNDVSYGTFVLSAPNGIVFPRNSTFRLWFFMAKSTSSARHEILSSIQLERNQRYLGLRATN